MPSTSAILTPVLQPATAEADFFGNIFELKMAFVKVEPVRYLIAGEDNIGQRVVVKVGYTYSATVVKVEVVKNVLLKRFLNAVIEVDTTFTCRYLLKKRICCGWRRFGCAGGEQE